MEYFYSLCINIFDLFSLYNIAEATLDRKTKEVKVKYWTIYICWSFLLNNFILRGTSLFESIVGIISAAILLDVVYYGKRVIKIFNAVIWHIFILTSEYLVIYIMMIFLERTLDDVLGSIFTFTVFSVLSRFIVYFLTFIFKKIRKSQVDLGIKQWLKLILFPLFTIFTCFLLMDVQMKSNDVSFWLFIDTVGLIITNVVILNLINQLDEEAKIKNDNILLNQQIKMEMSNIQSLMEAYASQRKMTHDFENHLLVIQGLAQKNNDLQTVEYTSKMLKQIDSNALVVHSNNNVVDAILNQKYMIAQRNDIIVEFKINDLSDIIISDEDMVTFLANAMDNAINAAKECKENKYIKVTIINENSETLVTISNTVNGNVDIKNYTVESKKNNFEHGYGLQNIKAVVDKYENIFTMDCKDNIFTLSAIFYTKLN